MNDLNKPASPTSRRHRLPLTQITKISRVKSLLID